MKKHGNESVLDALALLTADEGNDMKAVRQILDDCCQNCVLGVVANIALGALHGAGGRVSDIAPSMVARAERHG